MSHHAHERGLEHWDELLGRCPPPEAFRELQQEMGAQGYHVPDQCLPADLKGG